MKHLLLLVIFFFGTGLSGSKVFAQTFNYFYIDEYIRASEDQEYEMFLKERQLEEKRKNIGINELKDERKYQAWLQENLRQEFIEEKSKIKTPENLEKLEAEHLKQNEKKQMEQLALQEKYAMEKDKVSQPQFRNSNPKRMIASFPENTIVPKTKRKFQFKNLNK